LQTVGVRTGAVLFSDLAVNREWSMGNDSRFLKFISNLVPPEIIADCGLPARSYLPYQNYFHVQMLAIVGIDFSSFI
jgi:hypothetical protein